MKFCGSVGFIEDETEIKPGVWKSKIVEHPYVGDVLQNIYRNAPSNKQNENFDLNNRISIYADLYAQNNYHHIKYIVWNLIKWRVKSITINYPKLTLEIGGLYNENEKETTS